MIQNFEPTNSLIHISHYRKLELENQTSWCFCSLYEVAAHHLCSMRAPHTGLEKSRKTRTMIICHAVLRVGSDTVKDACLR